MTEKRTEKRTGKRTDHRTDQRVDQVELIEAAWRRERPDLDPSPQGIIGRLHRVARALTMELVAVYEQFGLSEGEFDALATLRRSGAPYGLRPADLARSTMVTTGGITKRLDRLEAAGLIVRTPEGTGDGRTKMAMLTAAGRALIDSAFTAHLANEHRLLEGLSRRDLDQLRRILSTWLIDLEDPSPDGRPPGRRTQR